MKNLNNKEELTNYINNLISSNTIYKFYNTTEWKKTKVEVLKSQHYECQVCKYKGKYTRADTVHHINYVRTHPSMALSKTYINKQGKEVFNLIAICKTCHNQIHEKLKPKPKFTNEERW